MLQYDQSKYEFVEARQVDQNLLDASSAQPALFLASNKTPGQVAVGAMKVDGQAVSGDGTLVEFTFRTTQTPLASDFQILDGVMVDLAGGIDAITNIEIGALKPMPKDYALGQNVPNPFNPSTTIDYRLPEAGDVQLVIYNLLGQEVRTLVRESMDAGFHSVVWDGTDEFGKQVASGIYIYRMSAADFTQVQRMMVAKIMAKGLHFLCGIHHVSIGKTGIKSEGTNVFQKSIIGYSRSGIAGLCGQSGCC